MSRLHLTFPCEGSRLAGTIDTAPGQTGLLIVTGGNEIRSGAFSGQARFAATIARAGFPVFRYDRRGVGDSDGENRGFRWAGADLTAALAGFRAISPQIVRVVGFGNCDAASALMLAAGGGCDSLILSNPWTIEDGDDTPPPAAIRIRYAEKLRNPRELMRLIRGQIDIAKLAGGLRKAAAAKAGPTSLAQEMQAGLARFDGPVRILLATADRTAQAFAESWPADDERIRRCEDATHAYAEPKSASWLVDQTLLALRS
ncbi:hydrolase 1, exosortase A system-associated [Pseudopontixanthobacter vadosimaris]|uniref:hydrolase 1, exosortase A system-associated n=1 Tax=Pseudopontixanthobacter vadosimaris TaxID=2726450 RepID=UPI0014765397|nr:hydrolase 1, exosortase A system-associated [Pseudopontixanthobacter vadosimaris]